MNIKPSTIFFILSCFVCILIIVSAAVGLSDPYFYYNETDEWRWQCYAQDLVNLVLVMPVLLITSLLSKKKPVVGAMLQPGVLLYLVYTYTIYCFDVHFNKFFLNYCAILAISFYLFSYTLYKRVTATKVLDYGNKFAKPIGIYFLIIAGIFYFLWLKDILPAIQNDIIPQSLIQSGLVTNPVYVLDLCFVLPGLFIAGILLLRNISFGYFLAGPFLVFTVLMDLTIAVLNSLNPQAADNSATIITGTMLTLATFSSLLLILLIKSRLKQAQPVFT
ncbi:hypothetical protein [Aurantibacillus circumpalustris]|uniref:hypothetical protein n=1 Tax=Aurantibacillus circumpalustris TaxID=3036359 RepID=UPI00295B4005|nr:hypothetical protein [Aurantibacillus circumpalustris]